MIFGRDQRVVGDDLIFGRGLDAVPIANVRAMRLWRDNAKKEIRTDQRSLHAQRDSG